MYSLLCTVVLTTLGMTKCSTSCSWYDAAVKRNMHMHGQVFRQMKLPSVFDCGAKCVMSSVCKSFNFDPDGSTCQLNNNSSDEVGIEPQSGSDFSDIEHWPKTLAGPCFTKICKDKETCNVDRLGRAVCSHEFQGCGVPPSVTNSKAISEGHFLHAEAVYTCDNYYRSCGQTDTWRLTCDSNETWGGVSFACGRYKWTEQVLDFNQTIACGPSDTIHITWTGKPQAGTHFDAYFTATSTLPFYIVGRLDDNQFAYNWRQNYIWGKAEYVHTFPFAVNEEFHMDMILKDGEYKVLVNGILLITFQEKVSGLKPEGFIIDGDIIINSVEIK